MEHILPFFSPLFLLHACRSVRPHYFPLLLQVPFVRTQRESSVSLIGELFLSLREDLLFLGVYEIDFDGGE